VFPYRDENETVRTPLITFALIAANVLIWLIFQGAGATGPLETSVCNWGLIPGELTLQATPGSGFPMDHNMVCLVDEGREPLHLLSAMFLHGGWMHLLGNMWFLWLFGNNVEDSMGRLRFVVFYLLCGVIATLAHVFTDTSSVLPMVGASGAISGVMGAYIVLYPRVRVYCIVVIVVFVTSVALPAWVMLGYWMLLQLVGGLMPAAGGGVAFGAHVGGFVAGALLVKWFARSEYIEQHRARHWRPSRLGMDRSSWRS
jgi:membrane associated rhomboid family serine protease